MSFQISTRQELKDFRAILAHVSGEGVPLAEAERAKYGTQRDDFWNFLWTITWCSCAVGCFDKALVKAFQGKASDFGTYAFIGLIYGCFANNQYRYWNVQSLSNKALKILN